MKNISAKNELGDLRFQSRKTKLTTMRNNISSNNKEQCMNINQLVTPPSSVWDKIESVLDEQNRNKSKTSETKIKSAKSGKIVNQKQSFYMTSIA